MPKSKENASYFYRKLAGYRQSLQGAQPDRAEGGGSDVKLPTLQTGVVFNASDATLTYLLENNDSDNPSPFGS